eukprot:8815259-Alexandrium_andersonii.AAC.1
MAGSSGPATKPFALARSTRTSSSRGTRVAHVSGRPIGTQRLPRENKTVGWPRTKWQASGTDVTRPCKA